MSSYIDGDQCSSLIQSLGSPWWWSNGTRPVWDNCLQWDINLEHMNRRGTKYTFTVLLFSQTAHLHIVCNYHTLNSRFPNVNLITAPFISGSSKFQTLLILFCWLQLNSNIFDSLCNRLFVTTQNTGCLIHWNPFVNTLKLIQDVPFCRWHFQMHFQVHFLALRFPHFKQNLIELCGTDRKRHYLDQLCLHCIYASLGLNELTMQQDQILSG